MAKKIRRIEIESAENGYTMRKHMQDEESAKGEMRYRDPEHTVHENKKSLMKHLDSCLQDDGGPKNSPKSSSTVVKKAIIDNAVATRKS